MRRLSPIALALFALIAASTAQAQTRLTLLLDWFVNPDHGPLFVAEELGYFAENGLKVEMIAPADPNDPPKLVAAGRADVAISYQPQLHLQVAEGLPVMRVATLVATPLNTLVVLKDGPIASLADLKGRKIGFSVGGFESALLAAMLGAAKLTLKDVTMVNVNFNLSPALVTGQVDAVIGAYRNFELNQLDLLGKPGRAFFVEEHGVPSYDELILIANRDKMDAGALRRLIDAIERGRRYMANHPAESWELFRKGRKDVDNELNVRAWRDTLPRFAHRPAALDRQRYERFAAFLKDQGLIKTVPPLASYAVELP
jgi:putative hydroxymethylpyrimidine transport system substrate-binding protein